MKKCLFLLLCLLFLALPVSAEEFADVSPDLSGEETAVPSGLCGENLVWLLDGTKLTISGTGDMADCSAGAPWVYYKEEIESVVLTGGITSVGAGAFENYDNLKEVDFGDALKEIGARAFLGCDGLTKLELPAAFKIFGEECLRDCTNLTEIHCSGSFPSFKLNCLWNSYLRIFYPAERPWPVSLVEELEGAFQGRIEFLSSDGTDPYNPTEPEVTEPETTAPETTEQVTETTSAPVEETTTPTTVPAAEPETTLPETTVPETTQSAPRENTAFGKWVLGLCLFTGALSLGLLTVLLLRRRGYREDYDD